MPREPMLMRRLGIEHPIIQAPMAGGATTVDLVVAVCEAGALGSLGCAYSSPDVIRETARAIRVRTERPFALNLFAPQPALRAPAEPGRMIRVLEDAHAALGIEPPTVPAAGGIDFAAQFEAVLDADAPVFSFTFGLLPSGAIEALHARGAFVMGTATTVDEAVALEAAGVDAIVAQGSEAGAHRGTFGSSFETAMVGTMALVPQIVDAVGVPVVASGGIMDGRGVAASLALGAQAAQLGTAFLTSDEAGIPPAYKQAILDAREDQTRITRAFSGRPARGIVNRLMADIDREPDAILPFPLQNALTRPARNAAADQDRAEFLSLWAGQGVRLARRQPAGQLVERIADELARAIERTSASGGGTA
ncbi:MAG: nitronate monooxygenase [Chloroflexota bacterium]|nr:nitronate monooxygenase [Chloroflexota bacterium]